MTQRRAELGLAALLVAFGQFEVWVLDAIEDGDRVVSAVSLGIICALTAGRRVWPLAVCTMIALTSAAQVPLDGAAIDPLAGLAALMIAVYSAAQHLRAQPAAVAWLLVATGAVLAGGLEDVVFICIILAGPWVAGRLVRERTLQAEALRRLAVENAELAVEAERARVARELHDAVAHAVSVMVVQAGAAEQVLDTDPDRARTSLAAVQHAGREASVELRRMVGLLRGADGERAALSPAPGMATLDVLLEDARVAGLSVSLKREGVPVDLPVAQDLSAYRIVQEALTNVRKHAAASRVDVVVRYAAGAVELSVSDDGRGIDATRASGPAGEYGLVGMRERVALFGGSLESGALPSGGFRVLARLPT